MKAYTDIEQSKKLIEFLPLESADMWFANGIYLMKTSEEPKDIKGVFPCWSLAALLEIIPEPILTYIDENNWNISTFKDNHFKEEVISTNPLNACYEMIIKLNEQKVL